MKSFIVLLHGVNLPFFLILRVLLRAMTPGLCKISLPTSKVPHLLAGHPPGMASLLPLTLRFLVLMVPKAFTLPPKSHLQLLL